MGFGTAGCDGLWGRGSRAEGRVPLGAGAGREVGKEPHLCPLPARRYCLPYAGVGQQGVGVEDRSVGDVISAEVEEPCQE